MKKTVLTFAAIAGLSTFTFGQKIKIPAAVQTSFEKQYPGTPAKWENEHGKYEANFKHNGHELSALYDASGTLEETETEIPVSQLPASVTKYIVEHQLGKIKEASKITKANGTIEYEAEVKAGDALFNEAGNFIKIEKEEE